MGEQEHILRVRNISKSFHKHQVLRDISFDVFKGEVLGIIGPSGGGKTTLLHTIVGFLKPDRGDVEVLVEPLHRALSAPRYMNVYKHMSLVKRVYGFASQIPSFYDYLTVKENLKYFASLYQLPKFTIQTNINILLHLMDLEHAANILAKDLSGGMERRLDIACALMHDPALLILDEPTADLDPVLRGHIYDLIRKINSKNTTILLSSHHLADLEGLCDRIAILKDGSIFAIGTPHELKDRFSAHQELHVKTLSNDYSKAVDFLKHRHSSLFSSVRVEAGELVVISEKSNDLIKVLLNFFERENEIISYLHLSRPSLNELFISIVQGDSNGDNHKGHSSDRRVKKKVDDSSEKKDDSSSDKDNNDKNNKNGNNIVIEGGN